MANLLFPPPKTMHLPAALRYAREGYAIRRVVWDGKSDSHELAWLVYRGGLFFHLNAEGRLVVQNDQVLRDDFLAWDWTLLPPDCMYAADLSASGSGNLPALPYPDWDDDSDPMAAYDFANPNAAFGLVNCQWQGGSDVSLWPEAVGSDSGQQAGTGTDSGQTADSTGTGAGSGSSGTGSSGSSGSGTSGSTTGSGSIGSSWTGSSRDRTPRPKPTPKTRQLPGISVSAQVLDNTCIPRLPEAPCWHLNLPDYSLQTREIVGTVHIGPDPQGKSDIGWITVRIAGQTVLRTTGRPGDSFDFGPAAARQPAGGSQPVLATIHFPGQDGGTVSTSTSAAWPQLCAPQGPCPPPKPDPDPDPGSMTY